jgi:hypothetical protein
LGCGPPSFVNCAYVSKCNTDGEDGEYKDEADDNNSFFLHGIPLKALRAEESPGAQGSGETSYKLGSLKVCQIKKVI